MKIKKYFSFILAILCFVIICGCTKPMGTPLNLDDLKEFSEKEDEKEDEKENGKKEVTAYLVPGKGCTLGGKAGEDNAELFLENSFTVKGYIGDNFPLPSPREKLKFVGYCESKDALANPILKFVGRDKLILYGLWVLDSADSPENPENPDVPDVPEPPVIGDSDFYLKIGGEIVESTRFMLNKDNKLNNEYILVKDFALDETFSFASKNPLLANSTETVYPTTTDRGFTLGRDKKNSISTDDFFMPTSIVSGASNSGDNPDGDFWAKTTGTDIKCKKAGKYKLYVVVYEGGWVKLFAQPV